MEKNIKKYFTIIRTIISTYLKTNKNPHYFNGCNYAIKKLLFLTRRHDSIILIRIKICSYHHKISFFLITRFFLN